MSRWRLQWFGWAILSSFGLLSGCGYPGDPLPPALKRPTRVADLAAVERGSKLFVQFTVPSLTTEGLAINGRPDIELRIGPMPTEGFSRWEKIAERVPETAIQVEGSRAMAQTDISKLYGKTVMVAVRVHGPHGQDVGWSRLETLDLVLALPVPEGITAKDAPDAIRLDWHAGAPEFRILRKTAEEKSFHQVGTSDKPFYIDSTIEYGKSYDYLVQSVEKTGERYAESDLSTTVTFKPTDKFAPAVPSGLTAVPGARTIELVWERNSERDFASYQIYRDGKKLAEGVTAPAYGDRDVKPGTRYRYQVLAVDTAGNSSELSAAVETAIP